jgi:cation diffusion facilitator CzcD-associated flavoprotein CzcO
MNGGEGTAHSTACDVAVIGAGLAGLYAVHRMLGDERGLSVRGFERGPDVGGVWLSNNYPGARVDMEAKDYSYRFSDELRREWQWSELFPSQPEMLSYLGHVADRFDLRRHFDFNTTVSSLTWDGATATWVIGTDDGRTCRARFVMAGTGGQSIAKDPDFPGLENFGGAVYATSAWSAQGSDLMNKRVGVIGTGTSAVQAIPKIAEQAAHLTVFQRTPGYAIPLRNRLTTWQERHETAERSRAVRALAEMAFGGMAYDVPAPSALAVDDAERQRVYDKYYARGGFQFLASSFADLLVDERANQTAAQYIRDRIAERVRDPHTARLLTPNDYPYGARRAVMETCYYETFNRDNVTLVDVRKAPITEVTETGLRTVENSYDLDVIVLALGFDSFTGPLLRLGITGRDGLSLDAAWSDGPRTYLGLASHGFPNLFMIAGPQSPAPLNNGVMAIEEHVEFISGAINHTLSRGSSTIEPRAAAQKQWCEQVNAIAEATLVPKANSWMMGSNIPGKPRAVLAFLAGAPAYRQICADVVANAYQGFHIT